MIIMIIKDEIELTSKKKYGRMYWKIETLQLLECLKYQLEETASQFAIKEIAYLSLPGRVEDENVSLCPNQPISRFLRHYCKFVSLNTS